MWGYLDEREEDIERAWGEERPSSSSSEVDMTIWVLWGRVVVMTDAILRAGLRAGLQWMWWLGCNFELADGGQVSMSVLTGRRKRR